MKAKVRTSAFCCVVLLATISVAGAGEALVKADGAVTWQAGVDGVEIEWTPNGFLKRISSRYSTPVEFGDRRGVAKGQVIAEEKAKAAIIRFLSQTTSSTRIVTELQADLNKATQDRRTGGSASVRKTDERTIIEALTEVTTSFAAGTLRGVIILEKGYDDKTQEAWVVVGFSDKTLRAARAAQDKLNDYPPSQQVEANPMGMQPGEVRRANQKDW